MVVLDLGVRVPLRAGAVINLHEPDAALDHASREQAEPAHRLRRLVVEPVELARRLGLPVEVDHPGRLRLHAEGHLVAREAGGELGLVGEAARVAAVQLADEVELGALHLRSDRIRREQVGDRLGPALDAHALVHRREEGGAPVARSVDHRALVVLHDHEVGQIAVLGADAVADPGAERRLAGDDRPRVHLADAGGVVESVGLAGADDRQVLGAFRDVRNPVGEPLAGLGVPSPLPLGGQQRGSGFSHRGDDLAEAVGQLLAGELLQERLGVEQVHLRRTALHEEEDHALGAGRDGADSVALRRTRGGDSKVAGEQVGEGHRAHAESGVEKEIAP